MCSLMLPISFFAGLINLVVGRFKKLTLRSLNAVKLLPIPLILILSMMFASLASLNLFLFTAGVYQVSYIFM